MCIRDRHNRNPGYSDFGNTGKSQSLNFSTTMTNPISHGANALKLENEITENISPINNSSGSIDELNKQYNEELLNEQETSVESIVENDQISEHEQSFSGEVLNEIELEDQKISNGLENFGVEEENAPDLFNSDNESSDSEDLLSRETDEDNSEEDDLEIPAFLRRQKN